MKPFADTLSAQDARDLGAYFATQKAGAGVADDTVIASGPYKDKKFFEVGQQLFRSGDQARGIPACMACHGPTGRGNPGPAYPSIAGQHANYTKDLLKRYRGGASYGKGDNANTVMSEVAASLSDQDIEALASYIEGLHRAGPGEAKIAGK